MSENEKLARESALFYQIVLTFHTAAWQQMGKVKNPITDSIEKDLNGAALSIDMLDMLKNRTKGNLSKEESGFLDRVLSELKLNYIEELKMSETKAAEAPKSEPKEKTEGDDSSDTAKD